MHFPCFNFFLYRLAAEVAEALPARPDNADPFWFHLWPPVPCADSVSFRFVGISNRINEAGLIRATGIYTIAV
jgi:hypothetical protein